MVVGNNALVHPAALTVEIWANFTTALGSEGYSQLIGKPFGPTYDDSFSIWYQNDLYAGVMVSLITAPDLPEYNWQPPLNSWHFFALTYDPTANNQILYYDGSNVSSSPPPRSMAYDTSDVYFGADTTDGNLDGFFSGHLAGVQLWSVARTADQISSDMACMSPNAPGIIGAWPLDDGQGLVAHDLGPNHLDASLQPSASPPTWTTNAPP